MRYRGYNIIRRANGLFDITDRMGDEVIDSADTQNEAEKIIDSYHTDTKDGGLVR